jgi:hypothetical protein
MKTCVAMLLAIGCVACNRHAVPPTAPSSPAPPAPLATPPIRGVLRETNGGPIAGVAVWLYKYPQKTAQVVSDASRSLVIPSSREVCEPGAVVNFMFGDATHWYKPTVAPACTTASTPPEQSILFKGEPVFDLKVGSSIVTTLSNDDFDWGDPGEYQCGPCKEIRFPLPTMPGTALVHVSWTGPDPVHMWLEGENDDYEYEKLAELIPLPGEHAMTLIAPQEFRRLYPWLLRVGLPAGSRSSGGFSALTTVRLELELVSS